MTNFEVTESATLTLATEQVEGEPVGKRWKALLIKSGWGSKAYYTEETLRRDGPVVFKAGTPIFLDHQTADERVTKPFGSVQNLAGELVSDAVWDVEEGGLVAEVEIFEHEQARVRSLAKRVGLSIRAQTSAERGNMEGRSGRIVTGLLAARSVDLVVRAGAGGQLLEVLESEEQEMDEEDMSEVTEKLDAIAEALVGINTRLTTIEESATAEAEVGEKEEVVVVGEDKTEIDPVELKKTISEAIAAELKAITEANALAVQESAHAEGSEENTEELEESAVEIAVPRHWAPKGNK